VWYICAMKLKGLAILSVLFAITLMWVPVYGQAAEQTGGNSQNLPASTAPVVTPPGAGSPTAKPDCNGVPCEDQQPRLIVTMPAQTPAPWTLYERIAWAANLVLVIVGYVGIMLALSTLKKIERHTRFAGTAAQAAADSAQAALLNAQAIINSERPWLLISVEPSLSVENGFTVMATNRGRTPAMITALGEQTMIAIDEMHLPSIPEYTGEALGDALVPIILIPGESKGIKTFARGDLKGLCESEERLRRVENWEEKLFIYGRVIYRDLVAREEMESHVTSWCCWYIHGRQKSGLVVAGPRAYSLHT
jgi:hypothetical protein